MCIIYGQFCISHINKGKFRVSRFPDAVQKWCFHVIPTSFWPCQKFEQVFLHPTLPSQPVSQKNPAHQANPYYSLNVNLFSWILSFTCLNFLVQFMWLSRPCDQFLIISLSDWQPSENDVADGMDIKEGLFWRPARLQCFLGEQSLGLGSIIAIFFVRGGFIFSMDSDSTHWGLSKKDFFKILLIFFGPVPKIWTFFSDKSSLLGNQLIPFERSTQFLPILMVFRLFKDPYQSQ